MMNQPKWDRSAPERTHTTEQIDVPKSNLGASAVNTVSRCLDMSYSLKVSRISYPFIGRSLPCIAMEHI